jgi:hypothetical protein
VDAERFDDLARSLTAGRSRRRVVALLATAALAQASLPGGVDAGKKDKPKKNRFGCIDVGEKCFGRDRPCCSGICDGKGRRSRCKAHHRGGCEADDSSCPETVLCGTDGECHRTTGKAGFCAEPGCLCRPCKKDKDCEAEFGEGAACVVCVSNTENSCVGIDGSTGTACAAPSPSVAP